MPPAFNLKTTIRKRGGLGNRVMIFLLPAVLALLLAACEFRIHADLIIAEDESGVLTVELAIDEELAILAGGEFGGDLAIEDGMVPPGWTAEMVSEEGYEGIRVSASFNSLDELGMILDELAGADTSLPGFLPDISPIREEDNFVFRLEIPENTESFLGEGLDESPIPLDLAMLDEVFDIRLALVLPGDVVTSNADVDTGETLIWNLSFADGGRILEAESRLPGPGYQMIVVWVSVALAAIVAIVMVVKIYRSRKAPVSEEEVSGEDVAESAEEVEEVEEAGAS